MADSASYRTLVQKFYIAYFGRPADPGGMDNMAGALAAAGSPTDATGFLRAYANNPTIREIVDSFGTSDESKALYPGNTATFLTAIYQNLFGRAPDSEGLAFWTGAIDRGEVVRGQAALNILVGAENNVSTQGQLDANSIGNKVQIAGAFTASITTPASMAGYAGDAAAAVARNLLSGINGTTNVVKYLPTMQTALSSLNVTTPGMPDLAAADDTGVSFADNITRQMTGLTFSGTAAGAVSVALYDNGGSTPVGSATVVNGRYSIDISLLPGEHRLTAVSTGSVGSFSVPTDALVVTVDGTPPNAPVAKLLVDSGIAGDLRTNNGQLTVSGLETGAQLEYRVNAGSWASTASTASYVEGANVVEIRQADVAGLASAASKISFTLDRIGPGMVSSSPANQGSAFAVAGTLTLEFGEALAMGSGNIVLRDDTGLSRSIAITDTSQVTVSGSTVVIKPATALLANRQYTLTLDSGTLMDAAGNGQLSTATGSTLRFSTVDTLAPTLVSSTPADNTADLTQDTSIVLRFSEAVKLGSGNFTLSNGTDVRTIAVTDTSKVSISGTAVTVKPGAVLDGASTYSLTMPSGVLKDLAGNAFAGLTKTTAVDFSTRSSTGGFTLSALPSSMGIRIDGTSRVTTFGNDTYIYGDGVGKIVKAAGDFNNDGFDDVLIGSGGKIFSYVLYGSASPQAVTLTGLNGTDGMRLNWLANPEASSANALRGLGDVNGDGIADVGIGMDNYLSTGYVLYGKTGGYGADMDLEKLTNTTGYRIADPLPYTKAGAVVAGAGDINGDGIGEVIFGAYGPSILGLYDSTKNQPGRAFLIAGKQDFKMPAYDALGSQEGYWFNGVVANDYTAYDVAGAGDFNRDGYDDFLIGSIFANLRTGKVQLFFGKAAPFDAQVSLAKQTSGDGIAINGDTLNDRLGWIVTGVGDFNGDGYADFLVSMRGETAVEDRDNNWQTPSKGAAALIFGHANDGTASMTVADLNGSNGVRFVGNAYGDKAGYSIGAAGDVNGDGYDDLIIGMPGAGANANGKALGATYVVFGTSQTLAAQIDLSTLDRSNSIRFDGAVVGDRVGTAVSGAGDFNGDGFADLIIGAPDALNSGGSAYIVYGRDFTGTVDFVGTTGADTWRGTSAAQEAVGGAGNDTLTGSGGADVLYGGAGNDTLQVADLSFRRIDGGSGTDTLGLGGADLLLDLAQFRNQISGIEVIDLTGTGNNTLTLLARDLLNLSDTSNTLRVTGNAGDTVVLGDGWGDAGLENGYHVYTQGLAVILVGNAVNVTFQ